VLDDGDREGVAMSRWHVLAGVTALAFSTLLSAVAAYASDGKGHGWAEWKGPGWYEVLYTVDSGYIIWSGPYASEDACQTYIKDRFSNKGYAENMRKKYGRLGDHENGFEMYCIEMKTEADAPPE
jgi:hypothetical protein